MNQRPAHPSLNIWASTQYVHDDAKRLAHSLRQEAMANFWRDAGALTSRWSGAAAHAGVRAATRLGHSLARHERQRGMEG